MTISQAVIATHRLGLGPRPGDLAKVKTDPKGWLEGQIGVQTSIAFISSLEVLDLQAKVRQARAQQENDIQQQLSAELRTATNADSVARIQLAISSETPFAERLVHFWSNHFAISVDKFAIVGLGGSFEGEAIRPNIFGRFEDLLVASTKHPGMLQYLDNTQSTGPNSRFGSRPVGGNGSGNTRGINENLAREILELHTLGVNGGYTQEDVTSFAKILTGWSVASGLAVGRFGAVEGSFAYINFSHEPGRHGLLGKSYQNDGIKQGEAVLRDLSLHPKTAEHIATKLARHFIADDPPASAVEALTKSFLDSGGDLPSLYKTLLDLDELWLDERQKFRTPYEWLVAVLRGIDYSASQTGIGRRRNNQLILALDTLGQPTWRPGSPAGWPDVADRWTSPDSLGKRIEWANTMAQQIGSSLPVEQFIETLYGTTANADLVKSVGRAESNTQALVLAAMAPDTLRR